MAVNVFGVVVDDAMLEELGVENPTKATRAQFAWRFINDDGKKDKALAYVRNLKDMYGNGSSTLCLVYNATGNAIRYVDSHHWLSGSLYKEGFPEEIGNGQWAAFLHVHQQGASSGSIAAVVYRGTIKNGQDRDFLIAWDTPWSLTQTNKAHCDIGAVNFTVGHWDEIYNQLDNHSTYNSKASADGTELEANTETGTSPTFTSTIRQL